MIEPTITAEDLSLYALGLLEGDEQTRVEAMLRKSTAAREELANIRGDLSLLAMGAEQHTPPALTRQRLLKQVARERRTVPVDVPVQDASTATQIFPIDRDARADRGNVRAAAAAPLQRGEPVLPDNLSDPVAQASPAIGRAVPTRTFPRAQQVRGGDAQAPKLQPAPTAIPRAPGQTFAAETEQAAKRNFFAEVDTSAPEPAQFGTDRPTFSIDPEVFPREARSLVTTATAHSITMFEQHFAAEGTQGQKQPELPAEPEGYSKRQRAEAIDALAAVQDTFVPSNQAPEEAFGFSSYREHDAEERRESGFGRWMGWMGWAVAAAVTVAAVFTLRDDFNLREQVSQQQSSLSAAEASASRAETVLQTLQSASTQHFQLAATDAAPSPSGRVAYLPERGTLVFQGSNLETLQPYKTYELWLIPAGQGRQPLPAGLFKPDAHGYATVVLPQLPKGLVAANFGVTIEDDGGSGTPTLPILLVGQQS